MEDLTADYWKDFILDKFNTIFNTNIVITPGDPTSDLILFLAVCFENMSEKAVASNNTNPADAVGQDLFDIAILKGITPSIGKPTTVLVELTNIKNSTIRVPKTTRFKSTNPNDRVVYFVPLDDVYIPEDSTKEVILRSEELGSFDFENETLTHIVTAVDGLSSVIDIQRPVLGTNPDNDETIYNKIIEARVLSNVVNASGLRDLILDNTTLRDVSIVDNPDLSESITIGDLEIPPGNFAVIYYPDIDSYNKQAMANVIYDKIPIGSSLLVPSDPADGFIMEGFGSNGTITVGAFKATPLNIHITVQITKYGRKDAYSSYGLEELIGPVKDSIQRYIDNLNSIKPLGNEVIMQRVAAACVLVRGCENVIVAGYAGEGLPSGDDIQAGGNEYINLYSVTVV